MRITDKDYELIKLVEQWGFLTALDFQLFTGLAGSTINWRLKRLVEVEMLRREKLFLTGEYAYLPKNARHSVNPLEFEHDQIAKRLSVYLTNEALHNPDPEAPKVKEVITDRQLRHEAALESGILGLSKKLPDFILEYTDNYKQAVEVELTAKHRPILKKHVDKCADAILNHQVDSFSYICGTEAIRKRVEAEVIGCGMQTAIQTALLPENIKNYQGGWPWPSVD